MGQGQAELDLYVVAKSAGNLQYAGDAGVGSATACLVVDSLGVSSSLQRSPDGGRAHSEGCTGGDTEGVHGG